MIQYPYEIESAAGSRWVFTANDAGTFHFWTGDDPKPAGRTCEEMVREIEANAGLWFPGECVYHGPLRSLPEREAVKG